MEPTDKFALKRAAYAQAVRGFVELLEVDLSPFDAKIIDGLKNGQAQKFEYTTELTWKIIRRYLLLHDGIEANSPKSAIKEFYLAGHVSEPDYESLIAMLDDRNHLSHVYRADEFQAIIDRLPHYATLMGKVIAILETTS
jgi:nucleotidyltransferase substrate binding protein (TIGR01987 family)